MSGIHFWFETSGFMDSDEVRSRNVNEIGGHDLAVWLGSQLKASGFEVSDPWDEDHGWDFDILVGTSKYLCVCSMDHVSAPPLEAHVSLSKERKLLDWLRGANKYENNDPVAAAIDKALLASSDVANLQFEIGR